MRSVSQILRFRFLVVVIVCGVLVALATGLFENRPEASIIGNKYYGYPLVWRVTGTFQPTEIILTNLTINMAFWIAVSFFAFFAIIILEKIVFPKLGIKVNYKSLILPLVLFIPLGLVMDFAHEFGHAMWGVAVGGRLGYMKVTFFEIYPRLAITPEFVLGEVWVNGIPSDFGYGLFLLGGALTTNIAAWLLALTLLKVKFGNNTQVAMRMLGLFGLLDLPFYVFLPQIGLQHWVFLGGQTPEPLRGARMMGIPDPAFYIMVIITTIGLIFFYYKHLRKKVKHMVKTFFAATSPKPPQQH
jgi:hypothetical protein